MFDCSEMTPDVPIISTGIYRLLEYAARREYDAKRLGTNLSMYDYGFEPIQSYADITDAIKHILTAIW